MGVYRVGKRQDTEKTKKSTSKPRKSSKAEKNTLSHADEVPLREKGEAQEQHESEVSSQDVHRSPDESVESTVASPNAILEEGQEASLSLSSNASTNQVEQPPMSRENDAPNDDLEKETPTLRAEEEEERSDLVKSVMDFFKNSAEETGVKRKVENENEKIAFTSEKKKGMYSPHLEDDKAHENRTKAVKKEQEKKMEATCVEEAEKHTAAPLSSSSISSSIPASSLSSFPTTSVDELLRWKVLLTAPYMIFDPIKNAIVSNPEYDRALAMRLSALLGKCSSRIGTTLLTSPTNVVSPSDVEEVAISLFAILEAFHTEGLLVGAPLPKARDASSMTPVVCAGSTRTDHPSSTKRNEDAELSLASDTAKSIVMGSYVLSNRLFVTFLENCRKSSFFHALSVDSKTSIETGRSTTPRPTNDTSMAHTHNDYGESELQQAHKTSEHAIASPKGIAAPAAGSTEDFLPTARFQVLEWCTTTARVLQDVQSVYLRIPTFREQQHLLCKKEENKGGPSPTSSSASTPGCASTPATAAEELRCLWQQLFMLYHDDGARSFFSSSSVMVKGKKEGGERRVGTTTIPPCVVHHSSNRRPPASVSSSSGLGLGGEGGRTSLSSLPTPSGSVSPTPISTITTHGNRVQELLCRTAIEKNGTAAVVILTRPSTAVPWGLSVSVSAQGFCYLSFQDTPTASSSPSLSSPSSAIEWLTPSPAGTTTSIRMLFDGEVAPKLRVRQFNYYPVPSLSPSSLVTSAEKKRKKNKAAPLLAKEEKAWIAHEAAMTALTQDITTRLQQCTTVALELLVEKSHRRPKPVVEMDEGAAGHETAPTTAVVTSSTATPDTTTATSSSSLAEDTFDAERAVQHEGEQEEEKELDQEKVREEEKHYRNDRMSFGEDGGEEDAPLVSDIPDEEEEDDVGREEEGLPSTAKSSVHDTTTESEKLAEADWKALEETEEGTTEAVPRPSLVEGLPGLGELAEKVLSSAKEKKKSKSEKRISEEVARMEEKNIHSTHASSSEKRNATADVEEENNAAGNATEEKTTDEGEERKQSASASRDALDDGADDVPSSSPLVFDNLVQLSDVTENVVQFSRKDLGMPWKLNVCFTKGEVCMTKLPPAPPHAWKHPFYQALHADKDGNVRWVIDAVNGKSIVQVPQSLKRKALETIKSSTTVSFALRGLRRL